MAAKYSLQVKMVQVKVLICIYVIAHYIFVLFLEKLTYEVIFTW